MISHTGVQTERIRRSYIIEVEELFFGMLNAHLYSIGLIFQDDANKEGGKWILRLRKGIASRYWENLVRSFCRFS